MSAKAPTVYVCDFHACIHNNGEGDCQRTSLTIGDDGRCFWMEERESNE